MATLFRSAIAATSLLHSSPSPFPDAHRLAGKPYLTLPYVRGGGDGARMRRGLSPLKAEGDGDGMSTTIVAEVAEVEAAETEAAKRRRASPLQKGGTLAGDDAEGKDPSLATLRKGKAVAGESLGFFEDSRWRNGTWDLQQFSKDDKVDWDAVIDAEVSRRKWLEENPEASSNSNPVIFDTSTIPWWAWVKRFHLPEAELLNGRAAMIGFFAAYFVDSLTGVGLVDQTNSFFGKLLLFITVVGVLLIRKNEDVLNLKTLANEWTFYDKQWQATWKDEQEVLAPEEEKKSSEKANNS